MTKLYEFGEGILRTHVTWEDLQEKVKEIWGEQAIFGSNKTATSIGDGRGFMSKMCLIDPDWTDSAIPVPKKFVAKICSQIAMTEANEKMREKMDAIPEMDEMMTKMAEAITPSVRILHNTEVNVYSLIERHRIDLPHPKIFAKVPFSEENELKAYLIMEYVDNALSLNLFDNVSIEDLKQALHGIAALEAASLQFSDEEQASLEYNPFKSLIQAMLNPTAIAQTIQALRLFAGHVLGTKIDTFEAKFEEILDLDIFNDLGPKLGMRNVLVHGDLWSTNMLWKKKESGEGLDLAAIVDYQTSSFSSPATDIFRAMGACLSGKDRQEHWEALTEDFYDTLIRNLKGQPAPYTLEQLKENYRQFFPMGACMLVPMIGPIFQLNQINPDPEERKKVEDLVMEKVELLMDDMLLYHARNMELKKDPSNTSQ